MSKKVDAKDKRKGLLAGYKKMGPVNTFLFWITVIGLVIAVIFFLIQQLTGATKQGQEEARKNSDINHIEVMEKISRLEAALYDKNNNKLDDSKSIQVLLYKIINSGKGYMKIRVSKDYLNTSFKEPLTLKYEYNKYQPVLLTFRNDPQWGAGIVFNSPEYKNSAEVYLNKCMRFSGFGRMTYIEDLIFELYFNDYCIYFATISGMVVFEHTLPSIRFGRNLCIGYFDENNIEKNIHASEDFPDLESFFKQIFQSQ